MKVHISLIAKFTFATSLILLLFMGLLDGINLKNFRKPMIEYAIATAEQIADIITQSTFDAMLNNDKTALLHLIERIANGRNIEHIRVIDQNGTVVISNAKDEVGSVIGKYADECSMCHTPTSSGASSGSLNRSRIIVSKSGKEVLGFTKAITNLPACYTASCHFHDKDDTVLGFLDISISLEVLRQKSHEYRMEFVIFTCMLLLIIGVFLTLLIHYLVDLPVQMLARHSACVASGNLASRVEFDSRDELGELSSSINHMTETLESAENDLKEWADTLESKVEERSREIMQMEEQLRRSEKLAALGTLAAGVAHEINNPLTGILLYASLVKNDKKLDQSLVPDLERVISETERCALIVKSLLDFSRNSLPEKESISLEQIIDEVVTIFSMQPDFSRITVNKHYCGDLPPLSVDNSQIRQVFMNLVINAGHAMPNGGVLDISTYLSAEGTWVCSSIKDSGYGISEENLARIFDPFFTTKPNGTGLGLSISYGIVQNHGGRIEVKSVLMEGTEFIVMLPVSV